MKTMELTHNILSHNAYWMVNKKLSKVAGIEGALLLADLISKEAYFKNNDMLRSDGYFYNSRENIKSDTTLSFHKQLKEITKLEELKVLETRIFRTNTGDAVKHFKINHEVISEILSRPEQKIDRPKDEKFNTNNNKYNNNKLNNISSKEDIWNSDEFHNKPSSIKEKQTTSSDQKEYFPHPFLEYWNSKPNLRTHKVTSKDYQNAAGMFNMLQNGVFGNLYRVEHEYAQTNKIKPETMRKVFTEEEIKAVIDKFDLMCSPDYVSKIKDGYPKSCSAFLWNPKTNRSFFMALYSSDNDIKPIKEAPLRQDVIDYYKDSLRLRNLNESEEADLVRSVNFIERRKVEYEKKMNQYGGCPYRLSGGNFYKTHLEWVRIKLQDTGRFELWKIANKFSWGDFVKWVKSNYGSECDMEIEIKDVKIMEECYN